MTFEELKELAKQNLPWQIIWFFAALIFSFIVKIPQAIYMAYRILRHNRASFGGGSGERRADIFIHLWNSSFNCDKKINQYAISMDAHIVNCKILQVGSVAEHFLNKLKLTEIVEQNGTRMVKAIKNLRNRLVYYFCIFWLVLFHGDTMAYYKNL